MRIDFTYGAIYQHQRSMPWPVYNWSIVEGEGPEPPEPPPFLFFAGATQSHIAIQNGIGIY